MPDWLVDTLAVLFLYSIFFFFLASPDVAMAFHKAQVIKTQPDEVDYVAKSRFVRSGGLGLTGCVLFWVHMIYPLCIFIMVVWVAVCLHFGPKLLQRWGC